MKDQDQNLNQLKESVKDFIKQINHLLELSDKSPSKLSDQSLHKIVLIIKQIEINLNELRKKSSNEELMYNTTLINSFIHQEFYIDKANTQKTSLTALKTLENKSNSLNKFKEMLTFWNNEKEITQVLFDDLYNIIDELAI